MSLRRFAEHLGVSDRMVSKWEAGGRNILPRPVNQEALDTSLAACGDEVRQRFSLLVAGTSAPTVSGAGAEHGSPNRQIRHPADGKLMAMVPAGVFLSGRQDEPSWLDDFFMDVHPTTNADYGRFVASTGHPAPQHWTHGRPPPALDDHPVVFVTWHDATAYARWAGKALPSSRQWEKAARGTRGDVYPWGHQPTPAKCNVREGDVRATTPVHRYHSGVSPYGVYDLCGNVWEWCSSGTARGRYELKGSAFTSPFHRSTPASFNDASADMADDDTGFRCVAAPDALDAACHRAAALPSS